LVIEDDRALTNFFRYSLSSEGYEVIWAKDGREGLRKAKTLFPDIIILDLMLPVMNGLDVCRKLRGSEQTREIPILLLTAKTEETYQAVSSALCIDDFATSPFSLTMLLQRIKARKRQLESRPLIGEVIEHQGVLIDLVRRRATYRDREVELTPTEFRLLQCLLRQPGRAFSRHQLVKASASKEAVTARTIDVHVKSLRRKLRNPELIEAVRSFGYRFREGPSR